MNQISDVFRSKLAVICAAIGIEPQWLLACMTFESQLDPARRNVVSGAVGLIQFMPGTARRLGTTPDALATMTAEEQLDYVERYFADYHGRLATFEDTYMAILWPLAVGQPNDFVLFRAGTSAYDQNKALDRGGKGFVTKADAASFPAKYLTDTPIVSPTTTTGTDMPIPLLISLITAFGPSLAELIPQIAKMMKPDSISSAKDAANVSKVLDVITQAAGTPNVQAAVEAMQASPELTQTVTTAIVNDPQIQQIIEVGTGGIVAARASNLQAQGDRPFWYNPAFWISLTLLAMPFMLLVDCFYVHPDKYQESIRTQIVTGVLLIISMVGAYWLGTLAAARKPGDVVATDK